MWGPSSTFGRVPGEGNAYRRRIRLEAPEEGRFVEPEGVAGAIPVSAIVRADRAESGHVDDRRAVHRGPESWHRERGHERARALGVSKGRGKTGLRVPRHRRVGNMELEQSRT